MIEGQRSLLPGNGLGLRQMLHVHELMVSYSARATVSLLAIATTDLFFFKMHTNKLRCAAKNSFQGMTAYDSPPLYSQQMITY